MPCGGVGGIATQIVSVDAPIIFTFGQIKGWDKVDIIVSNVRNEIMFLGIATTTNAKKGSDSIESKSI
jgi:hypothetical protein